MRDNGVPTYRSVRTGELYIGQSPDISDKNGIFEGFSSQGDRIPINPNSNKPYFTITDNPFNGEWVAGEVTEIPSCAFGVDNE